MVGNEEESQIIKIILSIIVLFGDNGLPLKQLQKEFFHYCGFYIPYKKFGSNNLRAWIITLPDIYLLQNGNEEVLIQQSSKSTHIKDLIAKQKNHGQFFNRSNQVQNEEHNKNSKKRGTNDVPRNCFIHNSINNTCINDYERHDIFRKLESMLPLFYKHQALGDDFLLDIADTKLGYYVPENGPKECGLCISGQTIQELTKRVINAEHLAPRVVVMIGFTDLLQGKTINSMLSHLNELVCELKKKNTRVTLITLIPSPKLPKSRKLEIRMDIFNKAILDFACSPDLKCNVIDMNTIFYNEAQKFQREVDRFMKVTKRDPYKVFSDYGRKVFLSTLKICLRDLIESGH